MVFPIASALRALATPDIVVLSSNRFAAGVSAPAASTFRGVQLGGGIDLSSLPVLVGVRKPRLLLLPPLINAAFARKLFAALLESLWLMFSREVGGGKWKGVLRGGRLEDEAASAGSSEGEIMRGVAFNVPHVISCFTAAGPSSEGVGDGIEGRRENPLFVGERGRSKCTFMSDKLRIA